MSDKRDLDDLTSLDRFSDEEEIGEEVTVNAIKRVIAAQLAREMQTRLISKAQLAREMSTSRTQIDRVLDPTDGNVTIVTLARAAKMVGRKLKLELV